MKKLITSLLLWATAVAATAAIHIAPAGGSGQGMAWSMGHIAAGTAADTAGAMHLVQGFYAPVAAGMAGIDEVSESVHDGDSIVMAEGVLALADGDSALWTVYDLAGRTILINRGDRCDLSESQPGIYIVSAVTGEGNSFITKIIKR